MADPFRDHKPSALARVDELERENERLEEELAAEREKREEVVETEERDPETQRLEEQMNALKKQVETLKAAPQTTTVDDNSDPSTNRTLLIVFTVFVLFFVALGLFLK